MTALDSACTVDNTAFLAQSDRALAEVAYREWKEAGFSSHRLLPTTGPCRGSSAFYEGAEPQREDFDSLRDFRKAKSVAAEKREEAKAICVGCPMIAQCLAASVTVDGDEAGSISYEEDCVYGGVDAERRESIWAEVGDIWTEEWEAGLVTIPGLELEAAE